MEQQKEFEGMVTISLKKYKEFENLEKEIEKLTFKCNIIENDLERCLIDLSVANKKYNELENITNYLRKMTI